MTAILLIKIYIGVPLLEESELEDINGETMSLAMENRSMTDNNSYKYSTSPELV